MQTVCWCHWRLLATCYALIFSLCLAGPLACPLSVAQPSILNPCRHANAPRQRSPTSCGTVFPPPAYSEAISSPAISRNSRWLLQHKPPAVIAASVGCKLAQPPQAALFVANHAGAASPRIQFGQGAPALMALMPNVLAVVSICYMLPAVKSEAKSAACCSISWSSTCRFQAGQFPRPFSATRSHLLQHVCECQCPVFEDQFPSINNTKHIQSPQGR